MNYQEVTIKGNEFSSDITNIQRTDEDGKVWSIPKDPSNSDYQAYLKWVANGGGTNE
jgi:hypothetical protein